MHFNPKDIPAGSGAHFDTIRVILFDQDGNIWDRIRYNHMHVSQAIEDFEQEYLKSFDAVDHVLFHCEKEIENDDCHVNINVEVI